MVELHDVQLLKLVEHRPVLELRRGVLRIELEDLEPATVQSEVDATAAERTVEFPVVRFTFQPAGSDRRDGRIGIDVGDHLVDGGPALRPQQRQLHAAYTCTVRPTSSSMPRRTS